MAFISSAKHSSRNEDGNTASVPTTSTNVPTASASVATISQDTACAYIAFQSNGSQIKFEDINQIDKDDMEEMAPRSQDRGRRDNFRQGSKAKEQVPRELMAIDGVGWDWSYMENNEEDHALVADEQENEGVDEKLAGLLTALKDLDNLIESQRSEKNKEGLGYTAVPPPTVQLYLSPKKDLSWTGLPECANNTVTDYSRPSPTAKSILKDDQNRNTSVSKTVASPITSKPFIKFVRPKDSQSDSKTDKKETHKKPPVKYAEQYRKPNMTPMARGNQRNWNNLKS
nr:hypothetical protein [Tanacetum cinerariifolium]